MPNERKSGDRLLENALRALSRALVESGAEWMVIGGIAIIAHGVRRFTTDIDAAVRGDAIRPKSLVKLMKRHDILPRIRGVLAFAERNLVLLVRHEPTGVDLDVSFAWSAFEHDALEASKVTNFGSVRVPMCTPENLVVFKAIAGRPRDIEDAEALLALYPKIDVARVRKRVAELSRLAEAPELLERFDVMAAVAKKAGRKPAATRRIRKKARRP